MFVPADNSPTSFKDFTLVMPAVAVGNVGQLAVDLIVSTLNMKRIGYIHTDCLIPMAGNNPYTTSKEDAEELHTPAEVYTAAELKLAVLQIRAPIIQVQTEKLILKEVAEQQQEKNQFHEGGRKKPAGEEQKKTNVELEGGKEEEDQCDEILTPLRYLVTPSLLKVSADALKELGWKEMERVSPFPGLTDANTEPRLCIPGGGITKGLYTDSCSEDLPLAVLLLFCSEGDNIPDAFTLVNHLNDWLHLLDNPSQEPNKWKIPTSWSLLFGSGIPPALF
ncbi:hypothetical protein INR49_002498 [Caranx melampygus]|nr:hypothetical protein INR49_002498 [Caranx melampygus]